MSRNRSRRRGQQQAATVAPQQYTEQAEPVTEPQDEDEDADEVARPATVKPRRYVSGDVADRNYYEMPNGRIVDTLEPGQTGRFLARQGTPITRHAAAALNRRNSR